MTTTLRHHSPLGPIAITTLRGAIPPDTDFDVPDHIAARLLEQSDVFELVDGKPAEREDQTYRRLRRELAEQGLPTDGKKADLLDRIAEADRTTAPPVISFDPPRADEAGEEDTGDDVPSDAHIDKTTDQRDVDNVADQPTITEPAAGQEGA